jgi:uncharacterized protein (UPF0332 family)
MKSLPVKFSEFLEWSEFEVGATDVTEFSYRNASSRAYYALFHAAKVKLSAMGIPILPVQSGGSHEAVICAVMSLGVAGREIADDMRRAKRFRHFCDYEISKHLDRRRARLQIIEASRLIDMLSRL